MTAKNKKYFALTEALREFFATEYASGIMICVSALLALMLANSTGAEHYYSFKKHSLIEGSEITSVGLFVNDVMMVIFFFIVGMELKREARIGFLSKPDQIFLPMIAAFGGIVIPALIFAFFNHHEPDNMRGWAIPSATDIAFAIAIVSMLGSRVPPAAKVFLLAIAIFDDLGAILIIAFFYNTGFSVIPLMMILSGGAILIILNRIASSHWLPYAAAGVYLWLSLHYAGIHTTLAGVMVGMAVPLYDKSGKDLLSLWIDKLHPFVSFFTLPLFAFVNAGITFSDVTVDDLIAPLPIGICLGLFFGKQIGIFGTTFLLVKTRLVNMVPGTKWAHIYGISAIAGIGFTMSLFINILAFPSLLQEEVAKLGVFTGSVASALWGVLIFRLFTDKKT